MHIFEKMAWIAILIAFTVLEVRAIGESDEENRVHREEQNERFAEIARELSDAYKTNQNQFAETLKQFSQTNALQNQQFKALVERDKKLFVP
jgi:hypothetical protein